MRIKLYLIPSSRRELYRLQILLYQIESNDISYGLFVLYDQYFLQSIHITLFLATAGILGILRHAVYMYFEVKMRPCAPARITYIGDVLVL